MKGFCNECGVLWSSPFLGCCCTAKSLSFVVEGLDLKLGVRGGEGFGVGLLEVEVYGGGEAMEASLSGSHPFDLLEL